jgi:hypothetical protein
MTCVPFAVAAAFALLTGCVEFGLDPVEPPTTVRVAVDDVFVQAALPATDVLVIVDDTASMAQEQPLLADAIVDLVDQLDAAGVGWQVGVTTTEAGGDRAGWLRGDPWVFTPGLEDRDARLRDALVPGTAGIGQEAGFAAAIAALSLATADGPNAGFRRPGANLHVIFVSDADDESDSVLGSDPASSFLDALSAESLLGGSVRVSAITGDLPSGCTSAHGTARPAPRYYEVVETTGGAVASICAEDWSSLGAALAGVAVEYPTRFPLSDVPIDGTVRVTVDGVRVVDGWILETASPAVSFAAAPPADAEIVVSYQVEVAG